MDLFQQEQAERLPLADADVTFWQHIDLGCPAQDILTRLILETPWREEDMLLFGKRHKQPRLTAWYGDEGAFYSYSGIDLDPMPWTQMLLDIRDRLQGLSGQVFNSVLLNYYRDERDSMGFHSDDEPELGVEPVIASLSLGEVRTFVFKHRRKKSVSNIKLPLRSGSLLLMKGATQANWRHGMPKETRPCEPRVNLTFRKVIVN